MTAVDAVVFDWGGTLTPWHPVDHRAECAALAQAVRPDERTQTDADDIVDRLLRAGDAVWARSRDHGRSATLDDLFAQAGLSYDGALLGPYREFWEPHTWTDETAGPMLAQLRDAGIAVGVLSNTVWPRAWHHEIFERDGVAHLIDAAVYTSEIAWSKPAPGAFQAILDALGGVDPARSVYVGDRVYEDVWGAHQAGLRAVLIPHSDIPDSQRGHRASVPDATAHSLTDIPAIVASWRE